MPGLLFAFGSLLAGLFGPIAVEAILSDNQFVFKGNITAFKELGNQIVHHREVVKIEGQNIWKIKDTVENSIGNELIQYWHIDPKYFKKVKIETKNNDGEKITSVIEKKWYSSYYGVKEESMRIVFKSKSSILHTTIEIKE